MSQAQRLVIEGKRFVLVRESEYDVLRREARRIGDAGEAGLPPLPKPDRHGNYPAVAYSRAVIARDLIRDRKSLGLSQAQLAERAGVRQETISRVESAKHTLSQRTYDKLFKAMDTVRRERKQR